MAGISLHERNQDASIYVGNLDERATEELLWELFLQVGPIVSVFMPRDRVTSSHNSFGFVEFRSEEDAEYAVRVMNMVKLHGKPIRVNKASADKKIMDVGANLFVGNLDPDVDESVLYNIFSAFGNILQNPKVMTDPLTGNSKGFGFVSFDSFESSDAAMESMHGQFVYGRQISVTYALKKDSRERHGSAAERLLAANNPNRAKPPVMHTLFGLPSMAAGGAIQISSTAPPSMSGAGGPGSSAASISAIAASVLPASVAGFMPPLPPPPAWPGMGGMGAPTPSGFFLPPPPPPPGYGAPPNYAQYGMLPPPPPPPSFYQHSQMPPGYEGYPPPSGGLPMPMPPPPPGY